LLLKGTGSFIIKQLVSDEITTTIGAASIPDDAYVAGTTRFTDVEFDAMIDALDILAGVDNSILVSAISTDVTVGQAKALVLLPSLVLKQLISDAVVDLIGVDNIAADLFVTPATKDRLIDAEILAMIDAVDVLAGGNDATLVSGLSTDVTVGQTKALLLIDSDILVQLVSDAIADAIDPDDLGKIPDDAYEVGTTMLTTAELDAMTDALDILSGFNDATLVSAISTDVTVGQAKALGVLPSLIIKQLVSDAVVEVVGVANIPDAAFITPATKDRLTDVELDAMIDAIDILAGGIDATLVSALSTDVTVGQAKALVLLPSLVLKQLISDAVVDLIGVDNIAADLFVTPATKDRLIDAEILAMIDAVDVLAGGNDATLVSGLSTDVTVGQTKALLLIDSDILVQLVSDAIADAIDPDDLGKIPDDAYEVGTTMITADELDALMDALDILVDNDQDALVSDLSLDINVGQIKALALVDSLVIKQLITDNVIDVLGAENVPAAAYAPGTTRLSDAEIAHMVDGIDILAKGNDAALLTDLTTTLDVGQTEDLALVDSIIVKTLISNEIINALGDDSVPDDAFIDGLRTNRLTDAELAAMVDVIDILAGGIKTTLLEALSIDVTVGQVKAIHLVSSAIVEQLISDAINDVVDPDDLGKVPAAAIDGVTGRITDAEIAQMVLAIDILAGGNDATLVSALSTEVTVGQIKALDLLTSLVLDKLMSDAIIEAVTVADVPLDAYVGGNAANDLTSTEITAMIGVIEVLATSVDPVDPDSVLVTDITTTLTVGQVQLLTGSQSVIFKQLFTDAVVTAIGAANIPASAYHDTIAGRLSDDEIDEMIAALAVLGNAGDSVDTISTAVTVGQVKDLDLLDSRIIDRLLSDAIIDAVTVADVPLDAYVLGNAANDLTNTEITAMIGVIEVLATSVDPVDPDSVLVTAITTNLTVGQVQLLTGSQSVIFKQLFTDAVVTSIGAANIPADAYHDTIAGRLSDAEIDDMIAALAVLGNAGDNVDAISTAVDVGQTKTLSTSDSAIVQQLITDAIVDAIDPLDEGKIPAAAYDGVTGRLTSAELAQMMLALDVLSGNNDNLLVSAIDTDITIGQLKGLDALSSLIMDKLISDAIITAVGVVNVPLDAYVGGLNTNNLTQAEVTAMIAVIETLAGSVVPGDVDHIVVSALDTDVTVAQTQALATSTSVIFKQLMTNAVEDAIGAANIPASAYNTTYTDRLSDAEIIEMADALAILGNAGDTVSTLSTDITVGQLNDLNSTIDSIIIDKLISDAIVDAIGVADIPNDAYLDDTPGNNLKPAEVTAMIDVIEVLAESLVPATYATVNDVPVSEIGTAVTVAQTQTLSTSTSVIFKQLMTNAVETSIGAANIPASAYNTTYTDRLSDAEIIEMADALAILGNAGDAVSSISTDITVGQLNDLNTTIDSIIIDKLISDAIVDAIGAADIPNDAYLDDTPGNNLKPAEVTAMIDVIEVLAESLVPPYATVNDVPVSEIGTDVTVAQTQTLSTSTSVIFKQLMTNAIETSIGEANIPVSAYNGDHPDRLSDGEIIEMADALAILGDAGDTVSTLSTDITVGQLNDLNTTIDSIIIDKLVSDAIVDAIGLANIPNDAYLEDTPGNNLKPAEVTAMIDVIEVLAESLVPVPYLTVNDVVVSEISADVTVGQTQDLKASTSLIFQQLMTNAIEDAVGAANIPATAYEASGRLLDSEIDHMIDVLELLADPVPPEVAADVVVSTIVVTPATLEVATLVQFPDTSIILNRMISTAIIDNIAGVPAASYVLGSSEDLLRSEIDYLLDALVILGIETDEASTVTAADITFSDLNQVVALGNAEALGYSPIVVHVISDPLTAAVSDVRSGFEYGVPSTAKQAGSTDLEHAEIVKLVDGLEVIGNVGNDPGQNDPATTTIDNAVTGLDPTTFGPTELTNLIAVDSLIIYRMISSSIFDAGLDNPDALAVNGDVNYDPTLPVNPEVADIKVAELSHIAVAMDLLGITSVANIATGITQAALSTLTPEEVETLVEVDTDGPNTIIYYRTSVVVDPDNDVYPLDVAYVMDGATRVRLTRASLEAAILAIP
ncbi:MAG: hypothetical protein K9K93_04540, partial [Acholeplasmataceae bacterium]|nr:hypothetical protein [Acholeplasmataceae bacterium]